MNVSELLTIMGEGGLSESHALFIREEEVSEFSLPEGVVFQILLERQSGMIDRELLNLHLVGPVIKSMATETETILTDSAGIQVMPHTVSVNLQTVIPR